MTSISQNSQSRLNSIDAFIMKKLYDRDYSQWAETIADLLASGNFTQLDIENLLEEVRDLSKRERDRLLSSLHHLLKWYYQSHKRSLFGHAQ